MKLNYDFFMAVETIEFLKKNKSNDYIQAEKIAKALDYPLSYQQKIMLILSKHGIVESKRGRVGGARLRKKEVTLLDIWTMTVGVIDTATPVVPELKAPLKAFSEALKKVVICK
jgi:DNA-binding IscR family transcriptional regulator